MLPWRRDGDKVFGPGCYDMKGGLYLAGALRQIPAAGKRPYLPVTFMLIPDEEVGSPSTRHQLRRPRVGTPMCWSPNRPRTAIW